MVEDDQQIAIVLRNLVHNGTLSVPFSQTIQLLREGLRSGRHDRGPLSIRRGFGPGLNFSIFLSKCHSSFCVLSRRKAETSDVIVLKVRYLHSDGEYSSFQKRLVVSEVCSSPNVKRNGSCCGWDVLLYRRVREIRSQKILDAQVNRKRSSWSGAIQRARLDC